LKNNVVSFGAKMVVKWSLIPIIDQAYFQALPISQHPTFYGSQKEYERQKVAESKRAERNERKRAIKRFKKGNGKKKKERSPNFGLCACTKLKYSTFL